MGRRISMIRLVEKRDKEAWYALDKHLPESVFDEKVRCGQGYVYTEDEVIIGVLRYNLFWDNTPFCTMLFIEGCCNPGRWRRWDVYIPIAFFIF